MSNNTKVFRQCRGCGCDFEDGTIATTQNKRFCHTCEFVYSMGRQDAINELIVWKKKYGSCDDADLFTAARDIKEKF